MTQKGETMELNRFRSKGHETLQIVRTQIVFGQTLTVYGDEQHPMFLAKEVAEWIDYAFKDKAKRTRNVSMMLQTIDEDEKLVARLFTSGQNRDMWFLTEDGVYEVLMQSRKPMAKAFKKEVKKVLKEIRKHGMYAKDELLDNPDLLIQVASELKKEREQRQQLEAIVDAQTPKVLFADAVTASQTSILVGELAKLIQQNGVEMGQNRLFAWLRENGYLIKKKGSDYNMPTQRSMELKLFEIKEGTRVHSDGHVSITKTTKVTGKGQVYFINKFVK